MKLRKREKEGERDRLGERKRKGERRERVTLRDGKIKDRD